MKIVEEKPDGRRDSLRYSDSIERIQPDEAELTERIVASMGRVNRKIFDQHRHAVRDAHANSHAPGDLQSDRIPTPYGMATL